MMSAVARNAKSQNHSNEGDFRMVEQEFDTCANNSFPGNEMTSHNVLVSTQGQAAMRQNQINVTHSVARFPDQA